MTKIEELEQKLNECQKALAEIQKEITELNELQIELKESKKEGKWKPQAGDSYCYRDYTEKIVTTTYMCFVDECRAKNMPIFKTKEECKRYWHFMDTVKEKSYEFSKEDFENHNIRKHIIYYDFERKCFDIDRSINIKYFGEIYFKTEEDAKYIIDNFKDELMEYFV